MAASQEMTIQQETDGYIVRLGETEWARFDTPCLGGKIEPEVSVNDEGDGWKSVRMTWQVDRTIQQDELAITFSLDFTPDLWWAPHLAPYEGYCIAQHVFRSPALIAAHGSDLLVIVPQLEIVGKREDNPWFMDYDIPARKMWLGMTRTSIPTHVLYKKEPGMTFEPGAVELGFFICAYRDVDTPCNPWARVSRFLWERYARPLYAQGEPVRVPMDTYVRHTYNWAFDTWENAVWQEFELNDKRVGGPAFIVNFSQSPNYPSEYDLREFLSIWNQAWFSTLRAASGMYRFAKRNKDDDLLRRANLVKELTLCAPMQNGLFPSVYRTEMERVELGGKKVNRSRGWQTGYWTNSNRVPWKSGVTDRWYHLLDASWTCLLMLRWYEELDQDARLPEYAKTYAERLLTLQDERGFFPGWLHPETQEPWKHYRETPETSMSVTFLLKLGEITGEKRYRNAALKAIEAVLAEIVPEGRWEDFETYFSCCQWGYPEFLEKRIPRNGMYKQCNFSMFWTAEALLAAYRATGKERYLKWGRRTLDELSMTQQTWQPPFIYVPALGGFGVMNCDGEWNDSRQCLFAELFMDYYRETGDPHLFERGVTALKSSFIMMYCPENPRQKVLWEKVWKHFGPEDYGFTMENYGHGGATSKEGEGVGSFTIFTWGNGAASEARARIHDHWGDVYIDRQRGQAFGIDSIAVEASEDGFLLKDLADAPRDVRAVFDDGTSRAVRLDGEVKVEE